MGGAALGGIGLLAVLGLGAFALILILWFVAMYNALVRRRIEVDNAFSQVDVQLKRRHDLIPNLVETVKGYAGHERVTLEAEMPEKSSWPRRRSGKTRNGTTRGAGPRNRAWHCFPAVRIEAGA